MLSLARRQPNGVLSIPWPFGERHGYFHSAKRKAPRADGHTERSRSSAFAASSERRRRVVARSSEAGQGAPSAKSLGRRQLNSIVRRTRPHLYTADILAVAVQAIADAVDVAGDRGSPLLDCDRAFTIEISVFGGQHSQIGYIAGGILAQAIDQGSLLRAKALLDHSIAKLESETSGYKSVELGEEIQGIVHRHPRLAAVARGVLHGIGPLPECRIQPEQA